MDKLIEDLKALELYDRSIVVVKTPYPQSIELGGLAEALKTAFPGVKFCLVSIGLDEDIFTVDLGEA